MMAWSVSNERIPFNDPARRRTIARITGTVVESLSTGEGNLSAVLQVRGESATRQVNQPELVSNHCVRIGGSPSRPVSPVTYLVL